MTEKVWNMISAIGIGYDTQNMQGTSKEYFWWHTTTSCFGKISLTLTMNSSSCVLNMHQPKWTAASIIREFTLDMSWKYNNWPNETTYLVMVRCGWTIFGNTHFINYYYHHASETGEKGMRAWRAWSLFDDSHARQRQSERNAELESVEFPLVSFKKRLPLPSCF